jgi:ABC-type transport system involved in cytochrome c biogenesis permease subunit
MTLLKFSFDRFTGTNTPRNYSSDVRIIDPDQGADRNVRIWMNHPLRYRGETFYQSDFNHATEHGTVLSVVHNPGWLIPYISCSMVALGMLIHFGMTLMEFFRKRAVVATTPAKGAKQKSPLAPSRQPLQKRPSLWFPGIATACCVIFLLSTASPDKQQGNYDLAGFGRVPVSFEGRVMPLDSLARNSLKVISGKSDLMVDDKNQPATWWLLNTMAKPDAAADFQVVRIDLTEILSNLNLDTNRKRFSVKEIMDHRDVLEKQANLATQVDTKKRDLYQRKILELIEHLNLFFRIAQTDELYLAPPVNAGEQWKTVTVALDESKTDRSQTNPGVRSVLTMLSAYHDDNSDLFNSTASDYASWLGVHTPETVNKVGFELIFNHAQPFISAMGLYILIFLMVCCSWMFWGPTLQRTAFWLLVVTLIFHTLGLAARIYIQGRPPVTNLYSCAIFVAWGVGMMCLGLELIYRNSIGTLMASLIGSLSLILAQNLTGFAEHGDTMQMMQAVLDTNFWLATHVVVVSLGYAATILAGFLAIGYVIAGIFTTKLQGEGAKTMARMVYGIICFAMLFSFVGTILGGIWADQSWGRFWGWDPKENGAVLVVFWNALILHSRWGGLVKTRGVMNLAIFGNVVTGWSFIGTNMLGVGLHSYGFMDSAVFWLILYVAAMLALIGLGSLPLSLWRSFREERDTRAGGFPVGASATV